MSPTKSRNTSVIGSTSPGPAPTGYPYSSEINSEVDRLEQNFVGLHYDFNALADRLFPVLAHQTPDGVAGECADESRPASPIAESVRSLDDRVSALRTTLREVQYRLALPAVS
jgi:hypothetical protein